MSRVEFSVIVAAHHLRAWRVRSPFADVLVATAPEPGQVTLDVVKIDRVFTAGLSAIPKVG